jgi:hypothetical protein
MRGPSSTLGTLTLIAVLALGCSGDEGPTEPPIEPGEGTLSGNITASRTLYKDTAYTLSGYVKVQNGAILTIQAGTRIIGDTTVAGSSLWILRGAQIQANGTAQAPIVFTSARSAGNRKPGDWGGIIIIGSGITNRNSVTVFTEGPQGASEQYTGGTNNASSSGSLRYVRIEFAGYDITGTGQELNALSSYVVGSGTVYEYIQVFGGLDDSFEWWGGAVDGRYLVSYESGDDHFDWTEGYRGRNQFLIAFQSQRIQPRPGTGGLSSDPQAFEADGCPANEAGCTTGNSTQPFSIPVFANFTLVGPGTATAITSGGDIGIVVRRGTGGYLTNGISARWQRQGLTVRDAVTNDHLVTSDSLNLVNLLLAENATNYDGGANFGQAAKFATDNHVATATAAAGLFTSLTTPALDWTPPAATPAASGAGIVQIPATFAANFFGAAMLNTTYFGAAAPGGAKWWSGWTAYYTCTAAGC